MSEREHILHDLELWRLELKHKKGPVNLGVPEIVSIAHDHFEAEFVGRTLDGLQFFVTQLFIPASPQDPGNEFLGTFLFNDAGDLVSSKVDEFGPRAKLADGTIQARRSKRIGELKVKAFQDIHVKPFAVDCYGELMGLIPTKYDDPPKPRWAVLLLPGNCMAFFEPWDSGNYDT